MDDNEVLFRLMLRVDAAQNDYVFRPNNSVLAACWRGAREKFHSMLEDLYRDGRLHVSHPAPPQTEPLPPLPPDQFMVAACKEADLSPAATRTVCREARRNPDNLTVKAVVALARHLQKAAAGD